MQPNSNVKTQRQSQKTALLFIFNKEYVPFFVGNLLIGLHIQTHNLWWEWENGEPVRYTNWARREPNNGAGREECVIILHGTVM